ncbi:MAG: hypothetical protein QF755_05025 [Candidatus Peribacteraceae bacterium]|nr:hypothetical protein [Candidatus Peribacteraceae bacterium]HCI03571.1 hypothetical protein [Candidatus Peribacteria bacterium]
MQTYKFPPLRSLLPLTFGLLILITIPASARTDCDTVKEEDGRDAYEICKAKEEEDEVKDDIKDFEKEMEDERERIEDFYQDLLDRIEDKKKRTDRDLERKEDDEDNEYDDMREDDADKDELSLQKLKLKEVQNERRAAKKYFDTWIKIIKSREKYEDSLIDLKEVEYEYEKRGGDTDTIKWY